MAGPVLADTREDAIIAAPVGDIDLTDWVFGLNDKEYQACSKDHIAAGATFTADGKRMSINVESPGGGEVIISHYNEDISERAHCSLISQASDVVGPDVHTRNKSYVHWEFFVEAIDDQTTKFTNRVEVRLVDGGEDALKKAGVTLEQAREARRAIVVPHNKEETPLFAKDIERKAKEGRWQAKSSASA